MDLVRIHDLTLECVIGVHDRERHQVQPVRLDVELSMNASTAALTGDLADSCDYEQVCELATSLLTFRRYRLLETATEELAAAMLMSAQAATQVRLRLEKPHALAGRARAASVEVTRTRADVTLPLRTAGVSLTLETLAPGESVQTRSGDWWWLVAGQIASAGLTHAAPGVIRTEAGNQWNPSTETKTMLIACRMLVPD